VRNGSLGQEEGSSVVEVVGFVEIFDGLHRRNDERLPARSGTFRGKGKKETPHSLEEIVVDGDPLRRRGKGTGGK